MAELTANINLTSTLLERVWTTLTDNGLAGLLRPWQIRRVGRAEAEARAKAILTIAQAERHAADIIAEKRTLLTDGTIAGAERSSDENSLLSVLETAQRTMLLARNLNLIKTIGYLMNEELHSDVQVSDDAVGRDWFTHWRKHAEDFSEERFQRLWAAVLVGEVRQPGSFSIIAMDILASISSKNAAIFQNLCNMSFSNEDRTVILLSVPGWHGPSSHYTISSPSTTVGEELSGYGIQHFHLLMMRTIGLLASLPEEEYPEWDILLGKEVDYAAEPVILRPKVTDGRIGVISFTEAGHQLRGLIDKTPHKIYTPALRSLFKEASVVMTFR